MIGEDEGGSWSGEPASDGGRRSGGRRSGGRRSGGRSSAESGSRISVGEVLLQALRADFLLCLTSHFWIGPVVVEKMESW